MKRLWIPILVLLLGLQIGCGDKDEDDDEQCPAFNDYQLLPEIGDLNSEFVLWVEMRVREANRELVGVTADLYEASGRAAGKAFDLVRVEDNQYRYLRTFTGDEVCTSGTCTLYFQVIAEHEDGCKKAFDTPLFQVVIDDGQTDDDDSSSNDDDNNTTE